MENLAYKMKKYCYEDLLEFDDENRYEIINGDLYLMSSPRTSHQALAGEIFSQLKEYLRGKKCKVFISPLDVILSKEDVVQPDIMVVCDPDKIKEKGIFGAPNFIIEILSPNNEGHDRFRKFNLYSKYGVNEYWIVDSYNKNISPYVLNKQGIYEIKKVYSITEDVEVNSIKDLTINLEQFYKDNETILNEEIEQYNLERGN